MGVCLRIRPVASGTARETRPSFLQSVVDVIADTDSGMSVWGHAACWGQVPKRTHESWSPKIHAQRMGLSALMGAGYSRGG